MDDRVKEELERRAALSRWRDERLEERRRVMNTFPALLESSLAEATQFPCEVIRSISDGQIEDRFLVGVSQRHFDRQEAVAIYFYAEMKFGTIARTRVCEMRIQDIDGVESIGNPLPFCAVHNYLWPPGIVARRTDEESAAQKMVRLTTMALADSIERGEKIVAPQEGSVRLAKQEAWYRD